MDSWLGFPKVGSGVALSSFGGAALVTVSSLVLLAEQPCDRIVVSVARGATLVTVSSLVLLLPEICFVFSSWPLRGGMPPSWVPSVVGCLRRGVASVVWHFRRGMPLSWRVGHLPWVLRGHLPATPAPAAPAAPAPAAPAPAAPAPVAQRPPGYLFIFPGPPRNGQVNIYQAQGGA